MRLLIATDAWAPQVNGVVRTLQRLTAELGQRGHAVMVLAPERFTTLPCPTYPEIRLALTRPGRVARMIEAFVPDHVHIATEGPIGFLARRWCRRNGHAFTTSYHTRFPEYLSARLPVPESWTYAWLRRFHNSGNGCMVATASLKAELAGRGFSHLMPWTRGVDAALFRPRPEVDLGFARPVFLYVGRVSVEKNIAAFLDLDLPGTKLVVGGGPSLAAFKSSYPGVQFAGEKTGEELARFYSGADVFVFPSLTDTFGMVLLEALASGLPVAAYPVTGPADVIGDSGAGALDPDLGKAALAALAIDPAPCRARALEFTWDRCADGFLENIQSIAPYC